MTSIGETLRRERLRRHLDLEQVSRETKISTKLLDAIEAEHFDKLPGGVFTKSFVRQYARMLGLDEDEIVGELERTLRPPQLMEMPAERERRERSDVPRVVAWNPGARGSGSNSALPAFALVVVVMLMCSAVYAWWQRSRSHPPITAPTVSAAVPSVPPPEIQPVPEVRKEPEVAPAPAPLEIFSAPVHVVLTAQEEVWVSTEADGKAGYQGVLELGQTRTVQAQGRVKLVVGNAGGLAVTLNGKPIGPFGQSGHVVILEITPEGFQTVRRKPVLVDDSL